MAGAPPGRRLLRCRAERPALPAASPGRPPADAPLLGAPGMLTAADGGLKLPREPPSLGGVTVASPGAVLPAEAVLVAAGVAREAAGAPVEKAACEYSEARPLLRPLLRPPDLAQRPSSSHFGVETGGAARADGDGAVWAEAAGAGAVPAPPFFLRPAEDCTGVQVRR